MLKAKPHCCENMIAAYPVRVCDEPATKVVVGGPIEGPYRMCAPCAERVAKHSGWLVLGRYAIFKIRSDVAGGHVHCDLFASPAEGQTFAKCGTFVVRVEEFAALKLAMPTAVFYDRSDKPFEPDEERQIAHGLLLFERARAELVSGAAEEIERLGDNACEEITALEAKHPIDFLQMSLCADALRWRELTAPNRRGGG